MGKKVSLITGLFLLLTLSVQAREYLSPFGFTIDLPDYWIVISRREFQQDPDFTKKLFDSRVFKHSDRALLKKVFGLVKSGQTELYVNNRTSTASFADIITVFETFGRIATDTASMKQNRSRVKRILQGKLGRKVRLYAYEPRTIGGKNVVFMEIGGMKEGTRFVSYQIQKSSNAFVTINMTTQESTLDRNGRDLERLIRSLRFTPSD